MPDTISASLPILAEPRPSALRWLAGLVLPTIGLVALAWWIEESGCDLAWTRPFFDPSSGVFPLRHHWFFAGVMHVGAKWLVVLLAAVVVGLAVLASVSLRWRRWLVPALYLAACLAITTGVCGWLKSTTNRYSPWSIDAFGGPVPASTLFAGTPAPFTGGHSFPAGHAAGGFAWIALFHLARALGDPRPAWWLVPGLLLGGVFAWTQHVRGAHFASHNLWTLAIAWSASTSIAWLVTVRRWWPDGGHREKGPVMASTLRPWLAGIAGLCLGCGLFAMDSASEALQIGGGRLHIVLEMLEFSVIGPGVGLLCFLLAERLRRAREQMATREQAERERRLLVLGRLAASVAHEVRNPLHTLRLAIDELAVEQPSLVGHPLRAHIDDALARIDHAVDLVYQLARPGGDEGVADLAITVRSACQGLANRPQPAAVTAADLPARLLVRCAPAALRMVVDNLLRNAIEAAGTGTVTVAVEAGRQMAVLRIVNPGRLPDGVCDPDGRPVPRASSKSGGLGLGLAISVQLVEATSGALTLRQDGDRVVTLLHLPPWTEAAP